MDNAQGPSATATPLDRRFFGHPAGLLTLFFAEMWERFSYYGMRALLTLFMTKSTLEGGLEFSLAKAGVIYAIYTSMVYFTGLAGGWLADNVLGQRRAVFWGGVVIMFGHIALAFHGPQFFYSGLLLIILGTGLLKPNISTMVGLLYEPKDTRRDSGFAIYYMGINVGSFLGQTVCGFLAQHQWFKDAVLTPLGIPHTSSWHFGFAAAAVGMFFGLVVFVWRGHLMGDAGVYPNPPADASDAARRRNVMIFTSAGIVAILALIAVAYLAGVEFNENRINIGFGTLLAALTLFSFGRLFVAAGWSLEERQRLVVIFILFLASIVFWGAFEQAGGLLNLFADQKSQLKIFEMQFPSTWYQNVNPFLIMLLAPLFAFAWLRVGDRAPSSPAKFAIGLLLVGVGFVVAGLGADQFERTSARISPLWLFFVYAFHTVGELFLSPIGLSMVTKLAPKRAVSQVMASGFWRTPMPTFLPGKRSCSTSNTAIRSCSMRRQP